jgi:hypothetical protein
MGPTGGTRPILTRHLIKNIFFSSCCFKKSNKQFKLFISQILITNFPVASSKHDLSLICIKLDCEQFILNISKLFGFRIRDCVKVIN